MDLALRELVPLAAGLLVAYVGTLLVVRASRRQRDRADALYREYGPIVYRRCLFLTRDGSTARQATEAVFGELLRAPGKLADARTALDVAYEAASRHCSRMASPRVLASEGPLTTGAARP